MSTYKEKFRMKFAGLIHNILVVVALLLPDISDIPQAPYFRTAAVVWLYIMAVIIIVGLMSPSRWKDPVIRPTVVTYLFTVIIILTLVYSAHPIFGIIYGVIRFTAQLTMKSEYDKRRVMP